MRWDRMPVFKISSGENLPRDGSPISKSMSSQLHYSVS